MNLIICMARGLNARLDITMRILENVDKYHSIMGLSDDMFNVVYKTYSKMLMDKRGFLECVRKKRALVCYQVFTDG